MTIGLGWWIVGGAMATYVAYIVVVNVFDAVIANWNR